MIRRGRFIEVGLAFTSGVGFNSIRGCGGPSVDGLVPGSCLKVLGGAPYPGSTNGAPVIPSGTAVIGAGQHDPPLMIVELGGQTGLQLGTYVGEQTSR